MAVTLRIRNTTDSRTTIGALVITSTTTTGKPKMCLLLYMLIPLCVLLAITTHRVGAVENTIITIASEQDELLELLHTETVLIDTLRAYVEKLDEKITLLKSKTTSLQSIHEVANVDMDKYLNNPINALTILKRFTNDWSALQIFAADDNQTNAIVQNLTSTKEHLHFPIEEDYDDAMANLLRIQEIYKLEPDGLAVGQVNGIKIGSEMSWSDCLEIGRSSDKNGAHHLAKFWMKTALGKLPAVKDNTTQPATFDEHKKAKFQILISLMNTENRLGNSDVAYEIADELLAMRPTHKGALKAKAKFKAKLEQNDPSSKQKKQLPKRKQKKQQKNTKTAEELLLEEICRDSTGNGNGASSSTSGDARTAFCQFENNNLPELLLKPQKIEILSLDPYIVIYHNVLPPKTLADLSSFLQEDDAELSAASTDEFAVANLQFTGIGRKRMARFTEHKLAAILGHASVLFDEWKVKRWNYENLMAFESPLVGQYASRAKLTAHTLFNLQHAKLGGAIVFPQLELSVNVPANALLYWTHLNEFHEEDYRTKQYVCPIIAGAQTSIFTSIRYAA